MRLSPDTLRVLHDPAGYYRPWQGRLSRVQPAQRSALNGWLNQALGLPAYAPPTAAQAATTTRIIQGWQRLPAAAWLMACAKQRNSVLGSRLLLRQPPVVQTFLLMGFTPSPPGPVLAPDTLLAWGGDHLQSGLREYLPPWVRRRMGLWFIGLPRAGDNHRASETPFDLACFWSAWNHAADLPGPFA